MDPDPVIVTTRDNGDYIWVPLYSFYTTTTGWGPAKVYDAMLGSHLPQRTALADVAWRFPPRPPLAQELALDTRLASDASLKVAMSI